MKLYTPADLERMDAIATEAAAIDDPFERTMNQSLLSAIYAASGVMAQALGEEGDRTALSHRAELLCVAASKSLRDAIRAEIAAAKAATP